MLFVTGLVTAFGASGGFWAWLTHRDTQKKAWTQLLLGLAHDRIIFLCMKYVDRGSITKDEYEDLVKYLWAPYSTFGGNGLAEKIMRDVQNLPMRGDSPYPHAAPQVIHVSEETHVPVNGIPRHTPGAQQGPTR